MAVLPLAAFFPRFPPQSLLSAPPTLPFSPPSDARQKPSPPLPPRSTPPPPPPMSHYAESSGVGRARSRVQGGQMSRNAAGSADPVGDLSGFPLIPCPDCGIGRVVEGRTKKESETHGRLYFKCSRNGFPKLCGYYKFEKQYFEQLKEKGIIVLRPSNWADVVEHEDVSVDSPIGGNSRKELEHKMESLIWKMNLFIACVVSVVFGGALMYVAMK